MKKLLSLIIILLCISLVSAQEQPKPMFREGQCECGSLELMSEQTFDGHGLRCEYTLNGIGHRETSGLGHGAVLNVNGYDKSWSAQARFDSDKNKWIEFCEKCEKVSDVVEEKLIHREGHVPSYIGGATFYKIRYQELYHDNAAYSVNIETTHKEDADKVAQAAQQQLMACGKAAIENAGEFPFEDPESKELSLLIDEYPLAHITAHIVTGDEDYTAYSDEKGILKLPKEGEVTIVFTYYKDKEYFSVYTGNLDKPSELILTLQDAKITAATFHAYTKQHDISIDEMPIEDFDLSLFYKFDPQIMSTAHHYLYISQALFLYEELGVTFNRPLTVYTYFNADCKACYEDQKIILDSSKSSYRHAYSPYIDFHEFSHYSMEELYGTEMFKEMTKEKNHAGYANPTTGDSWMEGYAAFMAVILADVYEYSESSSSYPLIGDLDGTYLPWELYGLLEEASVAAVLYDLVDDEEMSKKEAEYRATQLAEKLFESDWDSDGSITLKEITRGAMWGLNNDFDGAIDESSLRETFEELNFSYEVEDWTKDEFENEFDKMLSAGLSLDSYMSFLAQGKEPVVTFPITKKEYIQNLKNKATDDDGFKMDMEDLWETLKKPHRDFTSVYEELSKTLSVDKVFIQNGFYMDTGEGNKKYDRKEAHLDLNDNGVLDAGETYVDNPIAGYSYEQGEKVGTPSNYDRTTRRSNPSIPGMYVETKDVELVTISYANPFTGEYYELPAQNEDGKIYVPIREGEFLVEIRADNSQDTLSLSTHVLVNHMDEIAQRGSIAEHDFGAATKKDDNKSSKTWILWTIILLIIIAGLYAGTKHKKEVLKQKKRMKKQVEKHSKNIVDVSKKAYAQAKPKIISASKKTHEKSKEAWEKAQPHVKKALATSRKEIGKQKVALKKRKK